MFKGLAIKKVGKAPGNAATASKNANIADVYNVHICNIQSVFSRHIRRFIVFILAVGMFSVYALQ
jgi:hypothetical protein